MRTIRNMLMTVAMLLMFALFSSTAMAASYELSATMTKSFVKMTEAAEFHLMSKLNKQYEDWLSTHLSNRNLDAELRALQKSNDEALKVVKQQIKLIDTNELQQLKQQVEETKEQYKPLLDLYTTVNKQMSAAKVFNSKDLNSMFRFQTDGMKIPVQLAKLDIKSKSDTLKATKDSTSKKQKKVRNILEEIKPLEEKIKREKSEATRNKKLLDAEWKRFSPLVKQINAKGSSDLMTTMLSRLDQIIQHKNNMYKTEKRIAAIIAEAKETISVL